MRKRRRAHGKDGHKELRLSQAERLIVIGWALALFVLLYLIIPKNAERAVEHVGAHGVPKPSDTAIGGRETPKAQKH